MSKKNFKRKGVEDFIRIKVENCMLKDANNVLIHECPKCRTRYNVPQEKHFGVEAVVNFIMEIYDGSEAVKLYILGIMARQWGRNEN